MKRCPQCKGVESDEELKFCRVDEATLVNESSSIESEAGTTQLSSSNASKVHTSIFPHKTDAGITRATSPTTTLPCPRTKLSTANEQKLTKKYTENPEAYKHYLQGVFYWNQLPQQLCWILQDRSATESVCATIHASRHC